MLSEVEWEYLARAGTTSVYPWGPDADAGCESMKGADMSARSDYPDWETATCTDGSHHTAVVRGQVGVVVVNSPLLPPTS